MYWWPGQQLMLAAASAKIYPFLAVASTDLYVVNENLYIMSQMNQCGFVTKWQPKRADAYTYYYNAEKD